MSNTLLPLQGESQKNTRKPRALPWAKYLLAFQVVVIILSLGSCSPVVHKKITKPLEPLENTENVAVYDINEIVPDSAEVIGTLKIADGGFTTHCDWETILETAKQEVRSAGGNGLEILQHSYPGQNGSSCHQIFANILNINRNIKPVKSSASSQQLSFHDYVILNEGDTTRCTITDETKNHLSFIYGGQDATRSAILPKEKIIAYHIDDPVALAELQHQRNKKVFTARFGLEGGYAFRTAKFADGLSSDYKDYLRKLTRGPVVGANVRFNIDNSYTIGIHYDRFMSSNSVYAYAYDDDGNYYDGIVSDDHTINFIAASFGYFGCYKKHRLISEYLLGYMNYVDNGVEFGDAYTIDGATLGMGIVIDYDYMLSEHVGIGAGVSYYWGVLTKAKVNGYEQNLGNSKEGLQRVNLKAGIRYYF